MIESSCKHSVDVSIVIPLYNEEESVQALYDAVATVINSMAGSIEVVLVDDGSKDRTFDIAAEIALADNRIRVVKFRKNFGQTPAMAAGIDQASGEIIVTMDGDLQNDPADIPLLLEKIHDGNDIVVGWRFNRQDKLVSRKIPSRIANWLIGKVTGIPIKDNGCSLKAFRANIIKQVPLYSEMHRFIPAMASITGAKIAEIQVRHHARQFGVSKYGLSRVYKVLLDLLMIKSIIGFVARPLIWFATLAIPFFLVAISMFLVLLVNAAVDNGLSLSFAGSGLFFFFLSIFLIFNGALGELINGTGQSNVTKFSVLTAKEISLGEHSVELTNPKLEVSK